MDGRVVIAVDLGGSQIRAAINHDDRLHGRVQRRTPAHEGPSAVVAAIAEAIDEAASQHGVPAGATAAVGIAAPGPLNGRAGIVYSPPNLYGWRDVPLADLLGQRLSLPVHLIKDANAAALAEHRLGAGRGAHTMVYVTLSTGIGGGLIVNGKLFEGPDGTAGEVGHVTVDRYGPVCNCGNVGCVEVVASGTAIARAAAQRMARGEWQLPGVTEPTAADVFAAAQHGDPVAGEIVKAAARAIGLAFTGLVHLFNPERIVVGGGLVHAGSLLLAPLQETLRRHAMPVPRARVQLVLAELGDDVGLWGAALHARDALGVD